MNDPLLRRDLGVEAEDVVRMAGGRIAPPEEIAAFAAFPLSGEAASGAALAIDGGSTAS